MHVLEVIFDHFWHSVCLILVICFGVSGIVLAFRGKNLW